MAPDQNQTTQSGNPSAKNKNKKQQAGNTSRPKAQDSPNYKAMQTVETALTASNSLEIIGEISDIASAEAVLSTNTEYFDDKNASDIVDGEFRVLGKVVRVVGTDSEESINLLRKTAFERFPSELFSEVGTATAGAKRW